VHVTIGFRRDFPGGDAGGATQALLGGEKTFGRTDSSQGALVRKREKLQFFPATFFPEGHGGEDGGVKGGQGAGELTVLNRFEDVGGIKGKKQADGGGSVRGDGPEHEGEIESRPGPRFSGQILDGDEDRQRGSHGRGRQGGEKQTRPGHEKSGQEQTQGGGDDDRGESWSVHASVCSGDRALGEGEAD